MSQDEAESAPAQQPAAADATAPAPEANTSKDNELAVQSDDTHYPIDPKAETAVVAQAPFETRVDFDDDEWHLPEALVSPLTPEELAERERAEEDMRRRRDSARLAEEQRIADAKKATALNNAAWPVLPNEPTKTYDFSAVQLVADMNVDDDYAQPQSALAAVVPSGPPPPPEEPEIDDEPIVIEEPQQIMGPDQSFGAFAAPTPIVPPVPAPIAAPVAAPIQAAPVGKRRSTKAKKVESRGFAEWIHEYRLPIITFLMGVVVGVFIAFLV